MGKHYVDLINARAYDIKSKIQEMENIIYSRIMRCKTDRSKEIIRGSTFLTKVKIQKLSFVTSPKKINKTFNKSMEL